MHPKAGGRVVLEREAPAADEIRYRATLYVPDTAWRGRATVRLVDGVVTFTWDDDATAPPAWLVAFGQAFLRSEWKARQRVADGEPAPWPQRINRWREEKG